MRDVERAVAIGVPPFEFDNFFESEIGDEIEQVMRDDKRRRDSGLAARLACDRTQRLSMQMIEMGRCGYQYNVHWRQVAQIQSRLTQAL